MYAKCAGGWQYIKCWSYLYAKTQTHCIGTRSHTITHVDDGHTHCDKGASGPPHAPLFGTCWRGIHIFRLLHALKNAYRKGYYSSFVKNTLTSWNIPVKLKQLLTYISLVALQFLSNGVKEMSKVCIRRVFIPDTPDSASPNSMLADIN